MRLREAGIVLSLDKDIFAVEELSAKIDRLVQDPCGQNVLRMKRIANFAVCRKELDADLVGEVLYDHELRFNPVLVDQRLQTVGGESEKATRKAQQIDIESNDSPTINTGPTGTVIRPMHLQTADIHFVVETAQSRFLGGWNYCGGAGNGCRGHHHASCRGNSQVTGDFLKFQG